MVVFSFVYSSLTFSFQIYALNKHTVINNTIFCMYFLQEFTSILQFCVEVYSF